MLARKGYPAGVAFRIVRGQCGLDERRADDHGVRELGHVGGLVAVGHAQPHADQRFATQGDAESWVGEIWAELAEQGVAAVTLFEHDRQVYGPMSLSA